MRLNSLGAYGGGFVAFVSWFGDLSGECPTPTPEANFMLISFCVFQYLVAGVWIYGVASPVMQLASWRILQSFSLSLVKVEYTFVFS